MIDSVSLNKLIQGYSVHVEEPNLSAAFECPKCFSTYFGSSGPTNSLTYNCHDQFSRSCNWSGAYQDFFIITTAILAQELEEAYQIINRLRK